jgi:hypothetical protein
MYSKTRQYVRLPSWFLPLLGLDRTERQYLLFVATEDGSVRISAATPAERYVGQHLSLYLSGLWDEPSQDELEMFLYNEEMNEMNPPKLDEDGIIVPFPLSRLTNKERQTFCSLPKEGEFTYTNLRELGMSLSSSVNFIKKCLGLEMVQELEPAHNKKRGRPIKRFKRRSDFPREKPWHTELPEDLRVDREEIRLEILEAASIDDIKKLIGDYPVGSEDRFVLECLSEIHYRQWERGEKGR